MSLPAYPDFTPLKLEYLRVFNQAFESNPPVISEFSFTNLYAWRNVYKFKACSLDGLIILSSDSDGKPRFLDPIGKPDKRQAIERISNDIGGEFIRLPEETAALFNGDSRFSIKEDRDNSDYLYKTEDLINLAGKIYDGKRNLIKNFRANNTYEYLKLNAAHARECLQFEDKWCTVRNCDHVEGLSAERRAIEEMIEHCVEFALIGGAIKIGNDFSAVAIGQKLNTDTMVMHVLKAEADITGLYQACLQEFLSREAPDYKYINMEQDLGLPGLRKAKLSYHPVGMIRKYTLSRLG
jgi:uncharacterized protein